MGEVRVSVCAGSLPRDGGLTQVSVFKKVLTFKFELYNCVGLRWCDLRWWLTGSSVCGALVDLGGDIFSWSTGRGKKKIASPDGFRAAEATFLDLFLLREPGGSAGDVHQKPSVGESGPVLSPGSHFLLRQLHTCLHSNPVDGFHSPGFYPPSSHEHSGAFLPRDLQRKSSPKGHWFIRLSSPLPPVTQERSGEGRGVSTRSNFGSDKFSPPRPEKPNRGGEHREAGWLPAFAAISPPSPGRFSPLLPLSPSLFLPLSLRPFSRAVAGLCYRKRCGPRSAATSSTHTPPRRSGTQCELRHLRKIYY